MIIYEALDFTVGIFTKDGDTVRSVSACRCSIPRHVGTVKAKIKHFGVDGLVPGRHFADQRCLHDRQSPQPSDIHHPDLHEAELVGFPVAWRIGRMSEARLGGVTTDIFSEGLQIPIVKYARAGVVSSDIHDIIRMNVRLPERRDGRLARTDHRHKDRRAPAFLNCSTATDRSGLGLHHCADGSRGSGGARAHPRHSRWRL